MIDVFTKKKLLITGGYGFIGSNAVNHFCENGNYVIDIIDKRTYAADPQKIKHDGITAMILDICDANWPFILKETAPDVIINFAAESHVDNSILNQQEFVFSNFVGIQRILSGINRYNEDTGRKIFLVQVSTDEVYGDTDINSEYEFSEKDILHPNNPYSATKAAADLLIQSYHHTYKSFDYTIVRGCNNYGPGQYMEKFIPTVIYNTAQNKHIPIYGTGQNTREWIYVLDFVKAIETVMLSYFENSESVSGQLFNAGSDFRMDNLGLATRVVQLMGKDPTKLMQYVTDRKGHDRRYALDSTKIRRQLGFNLQYTDIDANIRCTIADTESRYYESDNSR